MWTIRNGFVELTAPQKSEPWIRARRRITASNVEKILGLSNFGSSQDAIQAILVGKEKSFSSEEQDRMDKGTRMEDPLRRFHSSLFPGSTVIEPSLCISLRWYDIPFQGKSLSDRYPSLRDPLHPNWFLAGSPDGFLTLPNGKIRNLEFKFTEKGYRPLFDHYEKWLRTGSIENDYRYSPLRCLAYTDELKGIEFGALDYFPHIWRSHFFQMQTCMAITLNDECDYGVGSPTSYYTETVPFDEKLWVRCLYPELIRIVEEEIKPKMTPDHLEAFRKEVSGILDLNPTEIRVPV